MKKLISIILTGVLVFVLVACGTKSSFEGEWKAVSIDTAGREISSAEQAMIDEMLEGFLLSVKSDGTAIFTRTDKENAMNGTWSAEGKGITLETKEEGDIKGVLEGKQLILNMDREGKIIFEKK